MSRRFGLVLLVLAAGAAAGWYATRPTHARPSPNAPIALTPLYLDEAGVRGDAVEVEPPQFNDWASPTGGSPHVRLRYSWESCDLSGRNCSLIPGLHTKRIVPPQELHIVALRAIVTATDRDGSRSVVTGPVYDMAGYPFPQLRFALGHLQYDPLQLRHWYGLRADEDGRGQTIVITTFWNSPGLRQAVLGFSLHYGLPRPCPTGKGCFRLTTPRSVSGLGSNAAETDLDVEWAHAIAPRARIVVLTARTPAGVAEAIDPLVRAGDHVFSSSWSTPAARPTPRLRRLDSALANSCGLSRVVCLFASGDSGTPGEEPANSPYVLAVGGVKFSPEADGSTRKEFAWEGSGGGGTYAVLPQPSWQKVPASRVDENNAREIPDVSALAKAVPYYVAGVSHEAGWRIGDGTSLATPIWAALIALADQELGARHEAPMGILELHTVLYEGAVANGLDDITKGTEIALPGWDESTGLGSPKAGIVDVLAKAIERYRAQR